MAEKKVVFDASHDEYYTVSAREDPSYRLLARQLVAEGRGVAEARDLEQALSGDVLVVPVPRREFSADEGDAVLRFVRSGGGLLLVGAGGGLGGSSSTLNKLAFRFGMAFGEDLIYHDEDRLEGSVLRASRLRASHVALVRHRVLEGVVSLRVRFACSVESGAAEAIVWAGEEPLAERSAEALRSAAYAPVLAVIEDGAGRVAALGDPSLFDNRYVRGSGRLAANLVAWLAGEPE